MEREIIAEFNTPQYYAFLAKSKPGFDGQVEYKWSMLHKPMGGTSSDWFWVESDQAAINRTKGDVEVHSRTLHPKLWRDK